eukprot:gene17098-15163_t
MVFTVTSLSAAAAGVVQQLLHVSRRAEARAAELRDAVTVAAAVAAALASFDLDAPHHRVWCVADLDDAQDGKWGLYADVSAEHRKVS